MRTTLSLVMLVVAVLIFSGGEDRDSSPQINSDRVAVLRRIQSEMVISDPVVRERESRYIQDEIDSLISGVEYNRPEIGPEILLERPRL